MITEAPKPKKQKPRKSETPKQDKEIARLEAKLTDVEGRISELEEEIRFKEEEMAKPEVYGNPDRLAEITLAYDKAKASMQELNSEWEEIASEIDALS